LDLREQVMSRLWWWRWVASFVALYVMGTLCYVIPGADTLIPLPFLPAGIAVAAVYRWGRSQWVPVFVFGVALMLTARQPLPAVLGGSVGFTSGALVSAWLLQRFGFDPGFSRMKDVVIFLMAVLVGVAILPTAGIAGFLWAGIPSRSSETIRWLRWWSETAGGAVVVAPSLLAINRERLRRVSERWLGGVGWMLGVIVCCGVIAFLPGPAGRSIVVMFGLMLVVGGAIRFGVVISSAGAAVLCFAMAYSISFGSGLFNPIDELYGRLTLFVFSATLIAASLLVSVLLAERDAAAQERHRAERQYAQIFNGSPQAIWVHDPVTRKFLLINDAALRQYGWTLDELLGRSLAALLPPGEPFDLPIHDRKMVHGYRAPVEARHITKDGRILEVELWMRSIDLAGRPAELVFALDVSERRALGRALIEGLVSEQRRIASEIHDGLGQELTGLALSLRALATRAARQGRADAEDLDGLAKLAAHCIEGSKNIVQGLSPLADAGGNLESALQSLARRASLSGTPVRFRAQGETPRTVKTDALDHFYRIAQEAVQNALKHASAAAIDIELRTDDSDVRLSVTDDGRGLPADLSAHPGLGMRTMRFRAIAIGGTLMVESLLGGGTAVRCAAPLDV
jgi:PAS domain S-box-containing protein